MTTCPMVDVFGYLVDKAAENMCYKCKNNVREYGYWDCKKDYDGLVVDGGDLTCNDFIGTED